MTAFTAGVPFRNQAILAAYPSARLAVQAAFGANLSAPASGWAWTDITTDVRQNGGNIVNITPMGRSDEVTQAQPAGLSLVLDNTSGDYTAFHPSSAYYPYVRRNTPVRVLVNLTGNDADTSVRFLGYANGWPMSWQDDGTARIPVVNLTASGEVRRIKQGKAPVRSALTGEAVALGAIGLWPLEDGTDATQAASALPNGAPLTTGSPAPSWANAPDLAGAGSLPQMISDTDTWTTKLTGKAPGTNASEWTVSTWFKATTTASVAATVELLQWGGNPTNSDNPWQLHILYDPTVPPSVTYTLNVDDTAYGLVATGNPFDGNWHQLAAVVSQNGANLDIDFYIDGALADSTTTSSPSYTLKAVDDIVVMPERTTTGNFTVWMGSVEVFDSALSSGDVASLYDAGYGFVGENAVDRLQRLCDAAGVALTVVGTSTTTMGAEPTAKFLDKLRDVETADGGLLLDGFGQGFLYVTREARYNQTPALTASAAAAQLAMPHLPQDNDQRDVNLFVATRKGGSSATYEDEDGPKGTAAIGEYDSSGTYNIDNDADIDDYASWAVHLGTVEGYRYPQLTIDFTSPDVAPLAADWLAVLPSYLVEVTDPATVFANHPPGDISVLVEGWGEQISPYVWKATLNCSPAAPWQVGTIEGDERLDCNGSTTNEALDTTETGVDVLITDNCVWAHDDGDYPIVIGGEVMTVTAVGTVSGSAPSRTQTLTVTRSVNGIVKSHSSGAAVHVLYPITQAL